MPPCHALLFRQHLVGTRKQPHHKKTTISKHVLSSFLTKFHNKPSIPNNHQSCLSHSFTQSSTKSYHGGRYCYGWQCGRFSWSQLRPWHRLLQCLLLWMPFLHLLHCYRNHVMWRAFWGFLWIIPRRWCAFLLTWWGLPSLMFFFQPCLQRL